jgi:hypothetical protein
MGRSKPGIDEEELQTLRQEFIEHRQETEVLRSEITQLKK